MQEVVLVHEQNADVIHENFEHEGKIIVPKKIKVEVEPIPVNKTESEVIKKPKVAETEQKVMSLDDYEEQYHTISAEESYAVAKFGNYAMLAGMLVLAGISYKIVPAILRRIGFRRQNRTYLHSPNPELTRMYGGNVYEEVNLYSTPKRVPRTRVQRTPNLKTP